MREILVLILGLFLIYYSIGTLFILLFLSGQIVLTNKETNKDHKPTCSWAIMVGILWPIILKMLMKGCNDNENIK